MKISTKAGDCPCPLFDPVHSFHKSIYFVQYCTMPIYMNLGQHLVEKNEGWEIDRGK
jgi:hypothetical protein